MKLIISLAAVLLMATSNVMAKECSQSDAEAADLAVDHLTSWQAVSDNFTRYGQCDDGDIAEGNSEAVIRLLVDKWKTLPALDALAKQNTPFGEWVLNHIDSTLDSQDLQKVANLATSQCPTSDIDLCQKIASAAKQAIEDN